MRTAFWVLLVGSLATNAWFILVEPSAAPTQPEGQVSPTSVARPTPEAEPPRLAPRPTDHDNEIAKLRDDLEAAQRVVASLAPEVAAVAFESDLAGKIVAVSRLDPEARARGLELLADRVREMGPEEHEHIAGEMLGLLSETSSPEVALVVSDLFLDGGIDLHLPDAMVAELLARVDAASEQMRTPLAFMLRGSMSNASVRESLNRVVSRGLRTAATGPDARRFLVLALSAGAGDTDDVRDAVVGLLARTTDSSGRRSLLRVIARTPGSDQGEQLLYATWRGVRDPDLRRAIADAYATYLVRPTTDPAALETSRSRFVEVFAACEDDGTRSRLLRAAISRLNLLGPPEADPAGFLRRLVDAETAPARRADLDSALRMVQQGDLAAASRVLLTIN
jgi:hypothetical protein